MANGDLVMSNYAAAFIDLLGQRAQLAGCDLLPDRVEDVVPLARASIAQVRWLHKMFADFYRGLTAELMDGDKRFDHPRVSEIRAVSLKYQRFSDGLVFYVSLMGPPRPEILNGVYGLVAASGALCLLGLSCERPIRGGIAVAWGAELNENELYGCVMARAYELESKVAAYPRIVVGEHLPGYLASLGQLEGDDVAVRYTRELASVTLSLLGRDRDGTPIVDYLGQGFRKYIATTLKPEDYGDAKAFIEKQLDHWRSVGDEKLTRRYTALKDYFQLRGIV
jgi:hypothetical protein